MFKRFAETAAGRALGPVLKVVQGDADKPIRWANVGRGSRRPWACGRGRDDGGSSTLDAEDGLEW